MIKLSDRYETFQDALYAPSFIPEKFYKKVVKAVDEFAMSASTCIYYDTIERHVLDSLLRDSGIKKADEEGRMAMVEEYFRFTSRDIEFDICQCLSSLNVVYAKFVGGHDILINSPQGRLI